MIEPIPVFIGAAVFLVVLGLFLFVFCLKRVRPGEAGVRTGFGGLIVTKAWVFCMPFLHRWDIMDIQVKKLEVASKGKDGLICQDKIRVDIEVSFYVRVGQTATCIMEVAETVGCEAASDLDSLRNMFEGKFLDALGAAVKQMDFDKLYTERLQFRDMIVKEIGEDLNGYELDDVAICYLEQTNRENHDSVNLLDEKDSE